jgi:beta-mannosidase
MKKRFFFLILLCSVSASAQYAPIFLNQWEFQYKEKWFPAQMPGSIYTHLLQNKLIANPYKGLEEKNLQWVSATGWQYRSLLDIQDSSLLNQPCFLHFPSLDGYADVYVNGKLLFQANNSFHPWCADITKYIRFGPNGILIKWKSKRSETKRISAQLPYTLPGELRVFSRSPQYQWGWDWGPELVSCGFGELPYLSSSPPEPPKIAPVIKRTLTFDTTAFQFKRNDTLVFIKGANWIPASSFYPVSCETYEKFIRQAANAGINMLRVWGGGVYEADCFYEICKKYGISIWQDFMFACAMYPGDDAFLNSVRKEAEFQSARLARHPNVVLFCGNNESDEGWKNWGWQKQYRYTSADSAKIYSDYLKLFHSLLPEAVNRMAPGIPYIPTSPRYGWGKPESMIYGDSHYWGVWWGKFPIDTLRTKIPRFMSEYGMQAFPSDKILQYMTGAAPVYDTSDIVLRNHQKHPTGFSTLAHYIHSEYGVPATSEDFAFLTREVQSLTLQTAIEAQRSAFPYCTGSLYWQLNDCWPVVSWSTIDSEAEPKPAMHRLHQLYARYLTTIRKKTGTLYVTVTDDRQAASKGNLRLRLHKMNQSAPVWSYDKNVQLPADSAKITLVLPLPAALSDDKTTGEYVLESRFRDAEGKVYRRLHTLTKPKNLQLSVDALTLSYMGSELYLEAKSTALSIHLPEDCGASENDFDMLAGEKKKMKTNRQVRLEEITHLAQVLKRCK